MQTIEIEKLLLSPAEVGQLLGISRAKVFQMLSSGQLPPSFTLGRSRKWRRSDLEKWIDLGMPTLDRFQQLTGGRQ